jgi:tRNA pseudouridine55 synthase
MDFLLINKPEGWTSFDVVAYVRKNAKQTIASTDPKQKRIKVGHAGTLDPFATGLLIVGVGREATKRLDEFKQMIKTYVATIKLGETSDTYDKTGQITITNNQDTVTKEQVLETLPLFKGRQLQIPPMFSAKKVNGQRLYTLARKGIEVERQPNEIEIYEIKLLEYAWPILKIEVRCSAGTYIRSLAHDIGAKLGVGAYCQELVRTQIGNYLLTNAVNINNLPGRQV